MQQIRGSARSGEHSLATCGVVAWFIFCAVCAGAFWGVVIWAIITLVHHFA